MVCLPIRNLKLACRYSVLYRGIANQPSPAYSSLYLSNFLSFSSKISMKLQARVFIFGVQVDNDVLYRGIANQPSSAYSSLYLSNFLSFHTLNDEIFCQRFV